jgi:hypothetical protein
MKKTLKTFATHPRVHQGTAILVLIAIAYASRFYYFKNFGLYLDDHFRVPQAMAWTWEAFWNHVKPLPTSIVTLRQGGRALHINSIMTLSFLGEQLGGLHSIYLIGASIVAANTILFYGLLRRLSHNALWSFFGGLAFALFPADTCRAMITLTLGIHPALTLLLVAFHLYLFKTLRYKILSYILIFLSFYFYERMLPVFLAAPLLLQEPLQKQRWEWLRHSLILGIIVFGMALGRKLQGADRGLDTGLSSLGKMVTDMVVGPVVSLTTYLYRPFQMFDEFRLLWIAPLALAFLAIAYLLNSFGRQARMEARVMDGNAPIATESAGESSVSLAKSSPSLFMSPQDLNRLALIGVVMLLLAYPFTLIGDATEINDWGTRVHIAAVVGCSMLVASACQSLWQLAWSYRRQQIASYLLTGYFVLLLQFGFVIQQDFQIDWQNQKTFWANVLQLAPDMGYDTVILVRYGPSDHSRFVRSDSRHLSWLLDSTYHFPQEWGRYPGNNYIQVGAKKFHQPVFYRLKDKWEEKISAGPGFPYLQFNPQAIIINNPKSRSLVVNSKNVIVLESENDHLSRRQAPLNINGQLFPLKQNNSDAQLPPYEPGVLLPYWLNN